FLVPLDSNREWWRYHGLFADLLRSRLKYNAPDRFRRLHLAAAAWHDEQRLADDSIRHALAADDPELAAELAERYFDDFILSSEGATAERWASSLPDEVVHRRPGLLLGRARIDMYAGRLDEAERGLDAAEHALPWLTAEGYRPPSNGGRTQFRNVEVAIVGTRMVIASLQGRPDEAMGYAERARRGLTDDDWLIRAGIEQQVGMAWFLRGQLPDAERAMRT